MSTDTSLQKMAAAAEAQKKTGCFFQAYLTMEDIFSINFFLSAYFWLTEFPPHLWIFGTTHIDGVLRRVIVILEKENVCDPLEWSLIDSYCWRETIHFHPLAPLSRAGRCTLSTNGIGCQESQFLSGHSVTTRRSQQISACNGCFLDSSLSQIKGDGDGLFLSSSSRITCYKVNKLFWTTL